MDPTPDILNQNHWSWRHRIVRSEISTGDSDDQPGWRTTDRGKINSVSLVKRNGFRLT